ENCESIESVKKPRNMLHQDVVQFSKEPKPIFVAFSVNNAKCQGEELALCIRSSCGEQNPFVLRFEMSSIDSEEGFTIFEPFCRRVKTPKQTAELICRCCLELDEASRIGSEKLFTEFRYFSIGFFVGPVHEFEHVFFRSMNARIRDNKAVHSV